MSDPFDLTGKVAIVTGGAGLIGTALCEALAERGATVVIADMDAEKGDALADRLGENGHYYGVDITDEGSVLDFLATVRADHGRVDVLVNAAYPRNANYGQRYENVSIEDWRENLDLHLNSYYLVSNCVSKVMLEQCTGGSIVNFGSTYGVQAPDFSVYDGTDMTSPVEYSAIKGGVINLTKYLASYLGKDGIRVNALSPGGVFDEQNPTFVAEYERRTPLKRMASPEDFKGPIVFLASDASAYVTGHNLMVDGGWTIC